MLFKETIPFVDKTAALPQSAEPHLEQQGYDYDALSPTNAYPQPLHSAT